jgi:hypothetical protein
LLHGLSRDDRPHPHRAAGWPLLTSSPFYPFFAIHSKRVANGNMRQFLPRFGQEFWETPNFSVGFAD